MILCIPHHAQLRTLELSTLASRKYLDALCVYFWATTPLLIGLLTFGTYVLLGNTLTGLDLSCCGSADHVDLFVLDNILTGLDICCCVSADQDDMAFHSA